MVKRALLRALLFAGLGAAAASGQSGTAPLVIDYPIDGSVFPPDIAALTFLWSDLTASAVSWQLDVAFANGSRAIHVEPKGERMQAQGKLD